MSFIVNIGVTSDPRTKVNKTFTSKHEYECQLKENCSLLDPVILVHTSESGAGNLADNNYMYISDFKRYYYITDIISVRATVVEIHGHVDVLKTYQSDIYKQKGIIERSASTKVYTSMLDDRDVYHYADTKTVIKKLSTSDGFKKSGSYVMVTAGPSAAS